MGECYTSRSIRVPSGRLWLVDLVAYWSSTGGRRSYGRFLGRYSQGRPSRIAGEISSSISSQWIPWSVPMRRQSARCSDVAWARRRNHESGAEISRLSWKLDQKAIGFEADAGRHWAESCWEAAALAAWVTCKSRFMPPPIAIPGAENPYSTTLDAIFGIVLHRTRENRDGKIPLEDILRSKQQSLTLFLDMSWAPS